jgi:hypothetical protein
MHRDEFSHLLWQIRRRKAEHLWEDCWRVILPNGRTLPVLGNRWEAEHHPAEELAAAAPTALHAAGGASPARAGAKPPTPP